MRCAVQPRRALVGIAFGVARLATWVGFWLLVVPEVLLSIRFAVTVPVLMVEKRGPTEALKASWARTREYQLTIFYAFVPVGLVLLATALVWMVLWTNVVAPPAARMSRRGGRRGGGRGFCDRS